MKIEQRIGRVDRIGQKHIVRALNFALEGTVELRVREVLEEKLARILEEFGVDKLADVLDSEEGGVPFEELFAQAIIAPEEAERRASALADENSAASRGGTRGITAAEHHGKAQPVRGTEDRKPPDAILDRKTDTRLLTHSGIVWRFSEACCCRL